MFIPLFKYFKFFFLFFFFSLFLLLPGQAGAADGEENQKWCVCYSNLDSLDEIPASERVDDRNDLSLAAECHLSPIEAGADCETIKRDHMGIRAPICKDAGKAYGNDFPNTEAVCREMAAGGWEAYRTARSGQRQGYSSCYSTDINKAGPFIPPGLLDDTLPEECKDISIFVQLLINFGAGLMAIIGAFALVFFIYGGFVMILSQGNPEKIKKGRDAMLAAIVGLIIAFSAYAAIKFMGTAVGVNTGDSSGKGGFNLK